jgi:hypothetical protein
MAQFGGCFELLGALVQGLKDFNTSNIYSYQLSTILLELYFY